MFDTVFEETFSNCLRSNRRLCVLLKNHVSSDLTAVWSMIMRTVAPQDGVSVFEFDANIGQLTEDAISNSMTDRIRNLTATLDEDRKAISSIYFACGVLEQSIIVIYNAENLSAELYQSLEKVERALRVSGKGKLRILLVGSEATIPLVADNTKNFTRVKWYNQLERPEYAVEMLNSVTLQNDSVIGQAKNGLIVFGSVL